MMHFELLLFEIFQNCFSEQRIDFNFLFCNALHTSQYFDMNFLIKISCFLFNFGKDF